MKKNNLKDPVDTLGAAYEKMYERAVKNLNSAKNKSGPLLHNLIDDAKHKAIQLEELAEDDAVKIADWLKRDISDKINYLLDTENELKDWLGYETTLLESAVLDLMLKTADKTTLELLKMKENVQLSNVYNAGDITGPGTLSCEKCGEKHQFQQVSKIQPCRNCHATTFHR